MAVERESLSGLIQRSETFSAAADEFRGIAENLGTDQGPEIFNPQRVVGLNRIGRLRIIGRIRGLIQKETIPYFEQQIAESTNLIIEQATAKAQVDIAEIRSMAEQGFLSQADLAMAEGEIERVQQDYRKGMLTTREFVNALISSQGTSMVSVPVEVVPAEPTPTGPEQPTPIEPAPTSEVEKLPVVVVNRRKKETESNGKQSNFSDLQWDALLNIIQAGEEGISTRDLEQAVKKAHPESKSHMGAIIHALRYKLEADFNKPKVITTTGSTSNARYFFNVDIEFIPSELVILENTNQVEMDGRRVELRRQELVLLSALVSKMDQEILTGQLSSDAFGNPNTTETGLRNIFARLAKKINYAWGDQSLANSGPGGLKSWYKAQNLVVSIKQAEKEPEEVERPTELVIDIETSIAEIQRLIDAGVLVSLEQIARAQEAVKQFGGTIEFQRPAQGPLTLPDGQDAEDIGGRRGKELLEILIAAYKKGELETSGTIEIASRIWGEGIDIKLGKNRLSLILGTIKGQIGQRGWTILNDNPNRSGRKRDDQWGLYRLAKISEPVEKKPEHEITKQERRERDESILLALEAIMDDSGNLTADEVLQVFGKTRSGRKFSYPAAVNSIYRLVTRLDQKVRGGKADPYDITILGKIRDYVGSQPDEDAKLVRTKLKEKLIAWFKGEGSLTGEEIVRSSSQDTTQQQSGIEVTDSSPKVTERQIVRQQEITERVRDMLTEMSQIESLPDRISSARMTWIIKHHLGTTITDTDIQKFIDRGYIEQFPGNDHHPSYNRKSLLTATYLRRFGNNMSKAQRRELLRIISREFSAWQAQRSNQ